MKSDLHGLYGFTRAMFIVLAALGAMTAHAEFYQVGPTRTYTNLQQVKALLLPGDVVEVDGDATYPGNVTFYHGGTAESPVIVRGIRVNGRRPVLSGAAITTLANVVAFRDGHITFEGFEIDGAMNPLAVRGLYNVADGTVIRDTLVHDCARQGIHGSDISGSLTLDKVEVHHCGYDLLKHQIYVNSDNLLYPNAVFRMQFCYIHDGNGGNNVKSRVGRNEIYYNWIEGAYYHELDLIGADINVQPTTASLVREDSDIVGNVIYKTETSHGVVGRWGTDGAGSSNGRYRFVNNTVIISAKLSDQIFRLRGPRQSVEMHNNVFYRQGGAPISLVDSTTPDLGPNDHCSGANNWMPKGTTRIPPGLTGTIFGTDPRLTSLETYDVAPTNGSPLLDAGRLPTQSPANYPFISPLEAPLFLPPLRTAPDPAVVVPRVVAGPIDLGAFETPLLPPGIITQPKSQLVFRGHAASFNVLAGGSLLNENPLHFQWQHDGVPVSEATNATYTIPSMEAGDAGNYTVEVTNIFGSVLSSDALLVFRADSIPPTASITYPPPVVIRTDPVMVVSGTAADDIELRTVLFSVNRTDNWQPVTSVRMVTSNSASWYGYVPLTPGSNNIYVKSVDFYDNDSPIARSSYFYKMTAPFALRITGGGNTVSTYTPFGTPTDGASLDIGRSYLITATPASGFLFSNWLASVDGGPFYEASILPKYCFTMQTNLTLIAQFVPNRFIGAAGVYNGLFTEAEQVTPLSAGFFTVKTDAKQHFSGKISLAGETLPFTGTFDLAGHGTTTKPLLFNGSLSSVTLQLQLPFDGSDTISGTVRDDDDSWVSLLQGDRAVYNTANPAIAFAGHYTLVIPGDTNAAEAPGGTGYATITIANSGKITLSGRLGDGTLLKQSVPVSKNGDWPFYCPAYPVAVETTTLKTGLIIGWLSVSNGLHGVAVWTKTPLPGDPFYPAGFTLETSVLGSPYSVPATGNRVIGLSDGSGALLLDGGNLSGTLSNAVFLSTSNQFTPDANGGLIIKLAPKTGLLTGSFKHPDNTNAVTPIYGVVLQNNNTGHGYFTGTNQTGSILLQGN